MMYEFVCEAVAIRTHRGGSAALPSGLLSATCASAANGRATSANPSQRRVVRARRGRRTRCRPLGKCRECSFNQLRKADKSAPQRTETFGSSRIGAGFLRFLHLCIDQPGPCSGDELLTPAAPVVHPLPPPHPPFFLLFSPSVGWRPPPRPTWTPPQRAASACAAAARSSRAATGALARRWCSAWPPPARTWPSLTAAAPRRGPLTSRRGCGGTALSFTRPPRTWPTWTRRSRRSGGCRPSLGRLTSW